MKQLLHNSASVRPMVRLLFTRSFARSSDDLYRYWTLQRISFTTEIIRVCGLWTDVQTYKMRVINTFGSRELVNFPFTFMLEGKFNYVCLEQLRQMFLSRRTSFELRIQGPFCLYSVTCQWLIRLIRFPCALQCISSFFQIKLSTISEEAACCRIVFLGYTRLQLSGGLTEKN